MIGKACWSDLEPGDAFTWFDASGADDDGPPVGMVVGKSKTAKGAEVWVILWDDIGVRHETRGSFGLESATVFKGKER